MKFIIGFLILGYFLIWVILFPKWWRSIVSEKGTTDKEKKLFQKVGGMPRGVKKKTLKTMSKEELVEELIKFCETKLWNLHKEEVHWQKDNQKELDRLLAKNKGWVQQTGKMIFISAILREFFNKPKVPNKVWKERRWKMSKDGNLVLTMPKKRKSRKSRPNSK